MIIASSDFNKTVEVGNSEVLHSLFSTVIVRLDYYMNNIELACKFLKEGRCDPADAAETARQFNLIRDELSQIPPDKAVYDYSHPEKEAPWKGKLSSAITSCGNLYTTADGKDLIHEITSVLCYCHTANTEAVFM